MPASSFITRLRLILTFYRSYGYISGLITLACAIDVFSRESADISLMVMLKIVSLPVLLYLAHQFKQGEYTYYRNRGVTKQALWGGSAVLDLLIFLVVILFAKMLA